MQAHSLVALSYLRGPQGEALQVVNEALSAEPCFLVIPGIAGCNALPLKRINYHYLGEEDDIPCWNLCSASHDMFVYIGEDTCIQLTRTSQDPLHFQLDIVLCFLMGGKINLAYPAWVI
jgi:hypothetical protein